MGLTLSAEHNLESPGKNLREEISRSDWPVSVSWRGIASIGLIGMES